MPLPAPLLNPHSRRLIRAAATVQQLLDAGRLLLRVDPARPGVVEAFDELDAARLEADKFHLTTVSLSPFMRYQLDIALSEPLTMLVAHLYTSRWAVDLDALLWASTGKTALIAVELMEWYARRGPNDAYFQRLGESIHAELLAAESARAAAEPAPSPTVLDRLLSMLPRRAAKPVVDGLGIFPARHG
ncbi:hypothetical protein [Methyloversatilis sp.]|uniref:hypothetical protein n=1 Tax=Methyloversatilis sp. TaxID=2569862 RepID=UPI002733D2BC|nr:hypothetical protein [Methyloversatilis sp.]MDP3579115.1 hypothetical protein [Methyloversatilis sp.]